METQASVASTSTSRGTSAPKNYRPVPMVSGALPVLGHSIEFARDLLGLLWRGYREHGEVAGSRCSTATSCSCSAPSAHEAVFRAPDEVLNPNEAYKIMTPVFGKDVVYDAAAREDGRAAQDACGLRCKDKRMRTYGEIVVDETRAVRCQPGASSARSTSSSSAARSPTSRRATACSAASSARR